MPNFFIYYISHSHEDYLHNYGLYYTVPLCGGSTSLRTFLLEKIQRRATKFILNDYTMDYKSRLEIIAPNVFI